MPPGDDAAAPARSDCSRSTSRPARRCASDLTGAGGTAARAVPPRRRRADAASLFDAASDGPRRPNRTAVVPSTQPGDLLRPGPRRPSRRRHAGDAAGRAAAVRHHRRDHRRRRRRPVRHHHDPRRPVPPEAIVKLVRPGFAEFEPARYAVVDSTRIVAIFDLRDAPHGLYDVKVINPDGQRGGRAVPLPGRAGDRAGRDRRPGRAARPRAGQDRHLRRLGAEPDQPRHAVRLLPVRRARAGHQHRAVRPRRTSISAPTCAAAPTPRWTTCPGPAWTRRSTPAASNSRHGGCSTSSIGNGAGCPWLSGRWRWRSSSSRCARSSRPGDARQG